MGFTTPFSTSSLLSVQSTWPFVLGLVLVIWIVKLLRPRRYYNAKHLPLPPGPKPLPLIGNILDIPTEDMGPRFRDMSLKHGDIMYLDALGQPVIVLNSHGIALDILDKRSGNYSDRLPSVMGELCGWEWTFAIIGYGPEWRRRRRALVQHFHQNAVSLYQPIQEHAVAKFIRSVIDDSNSFLDHISFTTAATTIRISYGFEVSGKDDPYVDVAKKGSAVFNECFVPGAFLVEILPFLRHLPSWAPGAGFKRLAAKWRTAVEDMRDLPFARTLEDMKQGIGEPSVIRKLLESEQSNAESNMEDAKVLARDTAAVAYGAGVDTTTAAIQAFFMAMVCYPEVQRKARAELDAVVGPDRLPAFADRDSLPYISAVVKEILRWRPVAPLGVPHSSTQDAEYNGYFIPGGSNIIVNLWAITQDQKLYPDPERFNPDRFLTKEGKLNPDVLDPSAFVFGYGRRICPGQFFAENSLFITTASILHTLTIDYARDERGQSIVPDVSMTYGVVSCPKPFSCTIKPRSPAYEALVNTVLDH